MERATSIANMTLPLLNTTLVYGIGVFVLYAVMPVVIVVFWSKKGKETQAVTSMVPYIVNAFVTVFAWLMFVTFISMIMILVLPAGDGNPAHGIDGFFHIDWLSPKVLSSLSGSQSEIFKNGTAQELLSAKMMVTFMSFIKLLYHILLILFYFFIFHFSFSLTSLKTKQANEEMGLGYAGNLASSFIASLLTFFMIFWIESSLLTGLLNIALDMERVDSLQVSDVSIDIVSDFAEFVRLGVEKWKDSLSQPPLTHTP